MTKNLNNLYDHLYCFEQLVVVWGDVVMIVGLIATAMTTALYMRIAVETLSVYVKPKLYNLFGRFCLLQFSLN